MSVSAPSSLPAAPAAQTGTPAISALMPVYNSRKWVVDAIASVLAQTCRDFELVIIDDGSTDGSLKAMADIAASDPRVRLFRRANRGLVATRNELLSLARAPLLAWCDSDDKYHPQRFEKQLAAFEQSPDLVALGSSWQMIDTGGLPIHTFSFPADHAGICRIMDADGNAMWFPTVMMKREAALRAGGFRDPFVIAEDYDLHLRLSEIGRCANLPDVLCYYRQHVSSTVSTRHWQVSTYSRLARDLATERRAAGGPDRLQRGEAITLTFDAPPAAKDNRVNLHTKWAWWALIEGHRLTARKHALIRARYAPMSLDSWRLLYCALRGH